MRTFASPRLCRSAIGRQRLDIDRQSLFGVVHRRLVSFAQGLRIFFQFLYDPLGIEVEYVRQLQKFHDIDATLAAFQPRDKRLILVEPGRELSLRQAELLSALKEELDQRRVTRRSDRLGQSVPRFF